MKNGRHNEYVPDSQYVEIIKIIKQESKNPAGSNQTSDKPIPYAPWYWYIYLHDWVILHLGDFVRANVGIHIPAPWFAYDKNHPRHDATIGFSHDSPKIHPR